MVAWLDFGTAPYLELVKCTTSHAMHTIGQRLRVERMCDVCLFAGICLRGDTVIRG